jgi:16S rRNA (guanine(966)-N(2))-methyltransferase RsmD
MRIISGTHKGRQLQAPAKLPVRPTTDRAKEALFNYLTHRFDFEEVNVLDLFAGTGNISYEFASRGTKSILAVDIHPGCVSYIRSTAATLGMDKLETLQVDVFKWLTKKQGQWDLVFADPPYAHSSLKELPGLILNNGFLKEDGLLILEHPANFNFQNEWGFVEARAYGQSVFSIFSPEVSPQ